MIELLVVVAILAILAALLLPALQSAKDTSRSTVCANSLRQLHLAFNLYADDYQDRYPPGSLTVPAAYYERWTAYVRHYLGGGVNGTTEDRSLNGGVINPYPITFEFRCCAGTFSQGAEFNDMANNRPRAIYNNPYFCPSTKRDEVVSSNGTASDYAPNIFTGTITGIRRSDIAHPTKTALLLDAVGAGGTVVGNASYNNVMPRHSRGTRANIICVDGHIESCRWMGGMSSADIAMEPAGSASAGPNPPGSGNYKVYFAP